MKEYILNEKGKVHHNSCKIKYIITENNCWECTSKKPNKDTTGYVRLTRNKKSVYLHRYVYELYIGEIPEGLIVRHKCDNSKCINPEHLEIGTHKDNTQDMIKRGRSKKGKSIIDKQLAIKIKEMLLEDTGEKWGIKYTRISEELNVNRRLVEDIKGGKRIINKELNGGYKDWIKEEK